MTVFSRRFLSDPGEDILLEIESVNIIDSEPPAPFRGVGTGVAMVVGEFEDGPFNEPTEVSSPTDLLDTFGGLGYTVDGVAATYPCARTRVADGAIVPEFWNGNGFVQLSGKKFARLVLVRVDTSVGEVSFTRLASVVSAEARFVYALSSGQSVSVKLDADAAVTATFTATAAVRASSGGFSASASGFTGGETITLGYDGEPNVTVTFLAADQSAAQVISRINAYAGFAWATSGGGNVVTLTSRKLGSGAQVRVVSGSTGALAAIGMTVGNTAGTGNVVDVGAVTYDEVKTLVEAASADLRVDLDRSGRIRLASRRVGGTKVLEITAATASALGFVVGQVGSSAVGVSSRIPAGTVVRNAGDTVRVVTMGSVAVSLGSAGPYVAKVRHAEDNGTGLSASAGTMDTVVALDADDAFAVVNPQVLAVARSEAQIDVAYETAAATTLGLESVAREVNLAWSARQSHALRRIARANALEASASGLRGRVWVVRPPLGTRKAAAMSSSAQPGVGATRNQRVFYAYPGANTYVPAIARRGVAGGLGFTADGNVDVGADGFLVSACSQLPPEENPGQETSFLNAVNGLETTFLETLNIHDYTAFKRAGIVALNVTDGVVTFQSGVTSVDPALYPGLKNIARRRMADYVQDSLVLRSKAFGKKLSTEARRRALFALVRQWLRGLKSEDQPALQRIADFSVSAKDNTPESLGLGLYRLVIKVRTLASLDAIVFAVTAGETVEVDEITEAA